MILGMLSWTMATIQDYRSGLQKKRRRQAQRHNKSKKINVLSRCTMILGMLSWTMATIQDYRSGLKKRGQQAQRHLRFSKLIYNMCFWTLGILA